MIDRKVIVHISEETVALRRLATENLRKCSDWYSLDCKTVTLTALPAFRKRPKTTVLQSRYSHW